MPATDFWASFGSDTGDSAGGGSTQGVAGQVLDSIGIPHNGVTGGVLAGLDIKSMDAMQAIKLSLMDNSKLTEIGVGEDGKVSQYVVGQGLGGGSGGGAYGQIQTFSYSPKVSGVMITGKKPPVRRLPPQWGNVMAGGQMSFNTEFLKGGCNIDNLSRYATVCYIDPNMSNGSNGYQDGISNFYENKSPWENIIGYARYISFPGMEDSAQTTITHSPTAYVPLPLEGGSDSGFSADVGTLMKRPEAPPGLDGEVECGGDTGISAVGGVSVIIPENLRYTDHRGTKFDGFSGINKVYIEGMLVGYKAIPIGDTDAISPTGGAVVEITSDSPSIFLYELKIGTQCQVVIDSEKVAIAFADNASINDPGVYGSGVKYTLNPHCALARMAGGPPSEGTVTLLPINSFFGYLVRRVFAGAILNIPSFTVYDPIPGKAKEICDTIEYEAAALVIESRPAPIALNGSLIDTSSMEMDHDPSTTQNFSGSAYEQAIASMDGGMGYTLSMPWLDEGGVSSVSSMLYEAMSGDSGSMTVFIDGPGSNPQVGGTAPDGGIINEVFHSYTDSVAYTVSVGSGPRIIRDFAGGGTSHYKMVDEVTVGGTIIEDCGNHVNFKVMLDSFGPTIAINGISDILRVGDFVQCKMFNTPVEG